MSSSFYHRIHNVQLTIKSHQPLVSLKLAIWASFNSHSSLHNTFHHQFLSACETIGANDRHATFLMKCIVMRINVTHKELRPSLFG